MAIPQSFIQELLARVDVVEVVGRHVQLKKGGANFMGLCPFGTLAFPLLAARFPREMTGRVVTARLRDARFFWDSDRTVGLEARLKRLDTVLFHKALGSYLAKTQRVQGLTERLAGHFGVTGPRLDAALEAARLLKADLATDMVGEFPELQGVMGGYYARHDGETEAVALAVEDHYRPRFAGDALPRTDAGLAGITVALAAPFIGAIADRCGGRKPFLAVFTVILALCGAGIAALVTLL